MAIYREVAPDRVPAATKQAAEVALQRGCALLGFALPPEVRWATLVADPAEADRAIKTAAPGALCAPGYVCSLLPFRGLNNSRHWCLWVATGQSDRETALTVLHELRHLSYRRAGSPCGDVGSQVRQAEEAEAEAWAQAQARRLSRIA